LNYKGNCSGPNSRVGTSQMSLHSGVGTSKFHCIRGLYKGKEDFNMLVGKGDKHNLKWHVFIIKSHGCSSSIIDNHNSGKHLKKLDKNLFTVERNILHYIPTFTHN